jgi:hypothetical protein
LAVTKTLGLLNRVGIAVAEADGGGNTSSQRLCPRHSSSGIQIETGSRILITESMSCGKYDAVVGIGTEGVPETSTEIHNRWIVLELL